MLRITYYNNMPYRKRRIQPSINKNAEKVHRRESLASSGVGVGSLHPLLDRLSIQYNFYDAKGNFLDQREQSCSASDPVNLQVDCLGPCGNGKINLEGKFRDMLQKQETVSEGRAKCAQTLYADSPDTCGYELRCHIEIVYKAA